MVFDGAELPAKKCTESVRAARRKENMSKGLSHLAARDVEKARKYFASAVDVTCEMASELMHTLRQCRPSVVCICAPYEADAQLAFLIRNHIVDAVISEDSDMIPYGCKDILFKLDKEGFCQRLELSSIFRGKSSESFDFSSFTQEMVIYVCIIAGCDYLNSLKGFGIKNSYKLVAKHKSLDKILRHLRLEGHMPLVPAASEVYISGKYSGESEKSMSGQLLQYELDFYKAVATFHHQTVYNPLLKILQPLTPIIINELPRALQLNSRDRTEWAFLGALELTPSVVAGMVNGSIHPETKAQINSYMLLSSSSESAPAEPKKIIPIAGFKVVSTKAPTATVRATASSLESKASLSILSDLSLPVEKENICLLNDSMLIIHGSSQKSNLLTLTKMPLKQSPHFPISATSKLSVDESLCTLRRAHTEKAKLRLEASRNERETHSEFLARRFSFAAPDSARPEGSRYLNSFGNSRAKPLNSLENLWVPKETRNKRLSMHSLSNESNSGHTDIDSCSPLGPICYTEDESISSFVLDSSADTELGLSPPNPPEKRPMIQMNCDRFKKPTSKRKAATDKGRDHKKQLSLKCYLR